MKGTILDFNEIDRTAVISGEDGIRYSMPISEWKAQNLPKKGDEVDFSVDGETAKEVYSQTKSASVGEKRIPAAILAFFLGGLGVHKFYLGYKTQGVIMLLVSLFGILIFGLPTIIIAIIAFVEFVIYLLKSNEEFESTYIIGRKGWF